MISSIDMRTFELALTDLTKMHRYAGFFKTRHSSPSAPMIDLSTSPSPTSAFSFVALSSSSLAISLIPLASDFAACVLLLGIFVDKSGKIIPRTEPSIKENVGLMDPEDSKAVRIGEVLPLREPKSCEKPPIPMPSKLVLEGQGH